MIQTPEASLFHIPFLELPDLAAEKVGGAVLEASDEFFAPKENLLQPGRGVFIAGKFTDRGKWMDGWESRRRRSPGHDWCVVRLGIPGVLRGLNVDTNHFLGNFPEYCSVDASAAPGDAAAGMPGYDWKEVLPKSRLKGGAQNLFPLSDGGRWTHLRLNIFPDGGVARLRAHGEPRPDWPKLMKARKPLDLAALAHGGGVLACNDMFFGPKTNLILPGRAADMGGGWETRRKRVPGHDWIIVRLGCPGAVTRIEVDTNHFKGNCPESCSVEGVLFKGKGPLAEDSLRFRDGEWTEVLPRSPLKPHARHFFEGQLKSRGPFSHMRLNIFPDGGVSRLRIYGEPDPSLLPHA